LEEEKLDRGRTSVLFKRTEWAKYGLILEDDDDKINNKRKLVY
jgi:hypothetical protein